MKDKIIGFLKSKDNYNEFDEILIDELLFNIEMAEMAKENIRNNGITVNVTRDPNKDDFHQMNRSISVYSTALKGIMTILTKLGTTPQERKKLKMTEAKTKDLFDQIIN